MAGAKRGCVQAQLTAEATWTVTVGSAGGGPDPFTLLASGASAYLPELLVTFKTEAEIITGATWTLTGSFGESGTGLITIDCNDPAWTVTWGSTNARRALGFTADLTAVSVAQVGTLWPKGLWMPEPGPKHTVDGDGDAGRRKADVLYTYAADGTVLAIGGSQSMTTNHLKWSHVSRKRSRISGEVVSGESWEQFWGDCHVGDLAYCSVGAPIRMIWDADTPGTYTTYKIVDRPDGGEVPVVQNWNGLYTVEFDVVKVPA